MRIERDVQKQAVSTPFRLGNIRVLPKRNLLIGPDKRITIEPKMMDLLCVMAEHAREVETREELIQETWHVEFGGDESLSRAISLLRKAFRDLGMEQPIIETIPRRGYRLIIDPVADPETLSVGGIEVQKRHWLVAALAVIMLAVAAFAMLRPQVEPPAEGSLAVLRFAADDSDQALADGLADGVSARLSSLPGVELPVGVTTPPEEGITGLGRRLGVAHLLTGTVRRQDEQLRVTVQLIDASDGSQRWARTFTEGLSDAFAAEDRLAEAIVAGIELAMLSGEGQPPADAGTESRLAWRAYLDGRRMLTHRGAQLAGAIERLDAAIAEDPEFARALAALSTAHAFSASDLQVRPEIAASRASSYARRSLALDPGLAEAHVTLGRVACSEQRWDAAIEAFDTALQREKDSSAALTGLAETYLHLGYARKASQYAERAVRIAPQDPLARHIAGQAAWALGEMDSADAHLRAAEAAGHEPATLGRALLVAKRGDHEVASALIAAALAHRRMIDEDEVDRVASTLARLMENGGDVDTALLPYPVLADDPQIRVMVLMLAGQGGNALALLEEQHELMPLLWLGLDEDLLDTPAFAAFARKVNLSAYWRQNGRPTLATI